MLHHNYRISIQVGLSGYSFKVYSDEELSHSSGWMPADRIFTTPEFHKRYDRVDISVFTPKAALIPSQFFAPDQARALLEEVSDLAPEDHVEYINIPELASVLVYSNAIGESLSRVISQTVMQADGTSARLLPEMYYMLGELASLTEYNKLLASYMDGVLYLVIAQGRSLLLCNMYKAQDFTTAQYFIFMAMKRLQLNPEVSTIVFRTPLAEDEEMSLYRYFKSVEQI